MCNRMVIGGYMYSYAVLNSDKEVVNVIMYDGISEYDVGEGLVLFKSDVAQIGGRFIDEHYIKPSPYPSWVLNSDHEWEAPFPMPLDGKEYVWSEVFGEWDAQPVRQ